jgi:hypothetical protein
MTEWLYASPQTRRALHLGGAHARATQALRPAHANCPARANPRSRAKECTPAIKATHTGSQEKWKK